MMETDIRTEMRMRMMIVLFMTILILLGMVITAYSQGITNSGGYITDAGTTSHSYVKFSGSGDMTLKSTTADRTALGNVEVDFTGTGSYKLTIPSDSYITVEGNLTLSDSLLLEASSSSNMASLITNGTVSGAYAIVEQHLVQDQWHLVSSPVSAAQAGVYLNCYFNKWNEQDSTWNYVTSTTENLTVGRGYHLWSSSGAGGLTVGPTDVEFTGLLNTGNYSPTITFHNASGEGHGWNEIGNPYPSAIEWNSSWTKTNVDATVYVYDGTQYKHWNYNYSGAPFNTMPNGEIPPTQGFWIKANASSPSITIPNSERVHSSNTFYKDVVSINNHLAFNISGNGFNDIMSLGTLTASTDEFDGEFDAYKLMGNYDAPQIYTYSGETKFAVNIFPEITEDKQLNVGFRCGADGNYILNVEGLDEFNPEIDVYLEDKLTGSSYESYINLREEPEYEFFAQEGLDESRFVLHFIMTLNGNENEFVNSGVNIYSFNKSIYINYQMDDQADVIVYDLMGKEITSSNLISNTLNTLTITGEKGYYIAKVISGNRVITRKVFID